MRRITCGQAAVFAPVNVWENACTYAHAAYVRFVRCINPRICTRLVRVLLTTLSTQNISNLSPLFSNFSTLYTGLTIMTINKPNLITVGV